jgi:hypothetical protein
MVTEMAANKLLGQFSLITIRQRPRSVPQPRCRSPSITTASSQSRPRTRRLARTSRVQPSGGLSDPEIGGDSAPPLETPPETPEQFRARVRAALLRRAGVADAESWGSMTDKADHIVWAAEAVLTFLEVLRH